jgi:hypothetical protein
MRQAMDRTMEAQPKNVLPAFTILDPIIRRHQLAGFMLHCIVEIRHPR